MLTNLRFPDLLRPGLSEHWRGWTQPRRWQRALRPRPEDRPGPTGWRQRRGAPSRARVFRCRVRQAEERTSERLHLVDFGGDGGGELGNRGDALSCHTFGRRGYVFDGEARGKIDAKI